MKGTKLIVMKELKRVFGDRRMIFSMYILPAILVIGIYSLMGMMIDGMQSDVEQHASNVTIVNAPEDLKGVIKSQSYDGFANIEYIDSAAYDEKKEELNQNLLDGKSDLVVYVDADFDSKVGNYKNAGDAIPEIKFYYNSTENYSSAAYSGFKSAILPELQNVVLTKRLGNLEQLTVYTTTEELIQKEDKANGEMFSMLLPYLITMMLFAGAMSVTIDAIAGEKERGTLASMLLSPVKRSNIVVGKLIALSIISGLSAIVYSVSMIIAMPMMGKGFSDGMDLSSGIGFSVVQILELLAIMLVMVYLFVGLLALMSVLAKDVKTAGSYVSPFYIVVILAGMMTMFSGGSEVATIKYAIPVYGNALAIKDVFVNELTSINFLASIGGTLLLSVIITFFISKAFNSEKLIFNA